MSNLKRCIELVAGLKTHGSLDADFVALASAANEELERLQQIERAAINIQERLDNHFGGGEHSDDWEEQAELRAALNGEQA